MIVGVLGDTHGRVEMMAAGMRILREAGAEYFLHTGDVGSVEVLDHLAGVKGGFVFGNNDWDRGAMARYAQSIGVECFGNYGEVEVGGKRLAVMHGDDARLRAKVLAEQRIDWLFVGHSHLACEEKVGTIRVINPGALHRAARKTVATVDLGEGKVRWLGVRDEQ
jgi:putative phosphoesterase